MYNYIDLNKASKALMLNEIGTDENTALKLSWAGNTNSGVSFGFQQIDTKHNSTGFKLLKSFDCTDQEIEYIKKFNSNPNQNNWNSFKQNNYFNSINNKIKKNKGKLIEIFDSSINKYFEYLKTIGILDINYKDKNSLIHLMDYHNQFDLSNNGKMHKWLLNQNDITPELIKNFKITQTKWGTTTNGKKDIERRFKNIESLGNYIITLEDLNLFKI